MIEKLAPVIDLFSRERIMSVEEKAHIIQRVTDLAIEISLLESEKEALERRLQ